MHERRRHQKVSHAKGFRASAAAAGNTGHTRPSYALREKNEDFFGVLEKEEEEEEPSCFSFSS